MTRGTLIEGGGSIDVVMRFKDGDREQIARTITERIPDSIVANFGSPGDSYLYVVLDGTYYRAVLGGEVREDWDGLHVEREPRVPQWLDWLKSITDIQTCAVSFLPPSERSDIIPLVQQSYQLKQ